jgi:hypothetical protein
MRIRVSRADVRPCEGKQAMQRVSGPHKRNKVCWRENSKCDRAESESRFGPISPNFSLLSSAATKSSLQCVFQTWCCPSHRGSQASEVNIGHHSPTIPRPTGLCCAPGPQLSPSAQRGLPRAARVDPASPHCDMTSEEHNEHKRLHVGSKRIGREDLRAGRTIWTSSGKGEHPRSPLELGRRRINVGE